MNENEGARQSLEVPIIVSGLGRSGSTWMQWFLSQHERIHIHGQLPSLPWRTFWKWGQTLERQGRCASRSNKEVGYRIAHYAGSDPGRCREILKRLFRDYLTGYGPDKPRWGLKLIGFCGDETAVADFESLWPETRWVVCIRDPFRTISSAKNTFVPKLDAADYARGWVEACRFVESHHANRVARVQMDKLAGESESVRQRAMAGVLACIGEEPTPATDDFVRRWPVVHKVKPDQHRKFQPSREMRMSLLDEVADLARYMEKMGYGESVSEA